MRRCRSLLFIALLIAANTAAKPEYQYLQALGDTRYHVVESSFTGQRYHLFVRLPEGYEDSKESYPVVYLLDGGWLYPLVAGYYKYLKEGDEVEAVIVNVDRKTRNINLSIKAKDAADESAAMKKVTSESAGNAGTTNLGALLKAKLDNKPTDQ